MTPLRIAIFLAAIFASSVLGERYYANLTPARPDLINVNSGYAILDYDLNTNTFDINLWTTIPPANITNAHIHFNSTRGVAVGLYFSGALTNLTNAGGLNYTLLSTGGYYVNIHTLMVGGGEISGTLLKDCDKGVTLAGGCACYAGFTGDEHCDTDSRGSCSFTGVDPLTTEVVAEYSLNSITSNSFSFVISSPSRTSRYFSSIALNSAACSYPGSNFQKNYNTSSCSDLYNGAFSIPEIMNTCAFSKDEQSTVTHLTGSILVTAVDPLPSFRGLTLQRTTHSLLKLKLSLPTRFNVTSNTTTLLSPLNLLVAVTGQTYDENDPAKATLLITTSVQWPYKLSESSVASRPNSLGAEATVTDSTLCPEDTPNSSCTQITTLRLTEIDSIVGCDFSGTYSLDWNTALRSGASEIPYTPSVVSSNITVVSGQVCATAEIEATLKGNLGTYSDAGATSPTITFTAGSTIFFKASLTADVSVQKVTVDNLKLIQGSTTTDVVVGGESQVPSAQYNSSAGQHGPSDALFSLFTSYGNQGGELLNSGSGAESVVTFTVQVDLVVTYVTTFGRKRDVHQDKVSLSQEIVIDATHLLSQASEHFEVDSLANSAAALSFGVAPALVGLAAYAAAN